MRTRIISAFPGTGKSYYHKNNSDTTLDSDSSLFSKFSGTNQPNPDFPSNYIKHIQENIGKYDFIFVSTHKEVREALLDNCIFFYLIYPEVNISKEEYLRRYADRGSSKAFIQLLDDNWDSWLRELSLCHVGCQNIEMCFDYIDKEIEHIHFQEINEITT